MNEFWGHRLWSWFGAVLVAVLPGVFYGYYRLHRRLDRWMQEEEKRGDPPPPEHGA